MRLLTLVFAACAALSVGALNLEAHTTVRNKYKAPVAGKIVDVVIANAPLVTQHGATVAFRDEVVADKIVVVSFFYSNCATICPVQSHIMQELQQALGARLDTEVRLVSISVDPDRDGRAQLLEQATRYGSQPGWVWLTGERDYVKSVLTGLRATAKSPEDHEGVFLIGVASDRRWKRVGDFPDVAVILQEIDSVAKTVGSR
jgi:protein SCO1